MCSYVERNGNEKSEKKEERKALSSQRKGGKTDLKNPANLCLCLRDTTAGTGITFICAMSINGIRLNSTVL